MTADQNYARIINEKFENERLQVRTQREYENALVALDNAKEKYERSLECTPLLNKRLQEAEKKKIKAHEEYEWICNNAPKR
jgi:exonuclease VII small subunit